VVTDFPPPTGPTPAWGPYYGPPPGAYPAPPGWGPPPVADPLISPDYSGWWSRGLTIVRQGWRQLAVLQALGAAFSLVIQVPFLVYVARSGGSFSQSFAVTPTGQAPDLGPFFALVGAEFVLIILGVIVTSIITLASVYIGVSIALGAPAQVSTALNLGARRVLPLIGWQLVAIPIYLVALCACILPVFYVAAVFTVLAAVVAIDRYNPIGRCFTLFNRNLGVSIPRVLTIFGLILVGVLINAVIDAFVRGVGQTAVAGVQTTVEASIISAVIGMIVSAAIAIVTAPLTLTAYADMRARVEAVNTTLIAQQAGLLAAPPPVWP
jgi:hypothetical protein